MKTRLLLAAALTAAALYSLRCPAVTSGPEIAFSTASGEDLGRPFPDLPQGASVAILTLEETTSGFQTATLQASSSFFDGFIPDSTSPYTLATGLAIRDCQLLGTGAPPAGGTPVDRGPVQLLGLGSVTPTCTGCDVDGGQGCQQTDCQAISRGGCLSSAGQEKICRKNQCTAKEVLQAGERRDVTAGRTVDGGVARQVQLSFTLLGITPPVPDIEVVLPEPAQVLAQDPSAPLTIAWQTTNDVSPPDGPSLKRAAAFAIVILRSANGSVMCRALDSDRKLDLPAKLKVGDGDGGVVERPLRELVSSPATMELIRMNATSFLVSTVIRGVAIARTTAGAAIELP